MKPVICFGEALIDFLNSGENEEGGLTIKTFRQYPGGAPANAAVAVAKLGGNAHFAGQVGDDPFGHFLKAALQQYGVHIDTLYMHPQAKTALAFVMLNSEGDRSFSFYRDNSADLLFQSSQVSDTWFDDQPIFHFCSNTLTHPDIATVTEHAVQKARARGCIVSFDVNLRHNLWPQGQADVAVVNQLVQQAHVVKFAREEFDFLSAGEGERYLQHCFAQGVQLVLITDGANAVQYWLGGAASADINAAEPHGVVTPPSVQAVDTTAAGDAFIGAMLFGISHVQTLAALTENRKRLQRLIEFSTQCSAYTVSRPGAFPALPDMNAVASYWGEGL